MNIINSTINYIKSKSQVDSALLWSLILLFIFGTASFFSAALGVMERNQDKFYAITSSQLFQALPLAMIGLSIGILVPIAWHYKLAPFYYIIGIGVSALVFIPSLSMHQNIYQRPRFLTIVRNNRDMVTTDY
jgi:cell division protein FtsW (lipid II flippase)